MTITQQFTSCKRESELASGTKLSSDGVSETHDADSVERLTDEVLRLDKMDFDDDENINSDTSESEIEQNKADSQSDANTRWHVLQ